MARGTPDAEPCLAQAAKHSWNQARRGSHIGSIILTRPSAGLTLLCRCEIALETAISTARQPPHHLRLVYESGATVVCLLQSRKISLYSELCRNGDIARVHDVQPGQGSYAFLCSQVG